MSTMTISRLPDPAPLVTRAVVMPYEGRSFAKSRDIRRACKPGFRVDLLIRRPEDIEPRYRWADPIIREALDHGEVLYG